MKKLMFALATVVVAAGAFTAAQQGQRRAPDPRSMGGGDCRDNPYNCADAPNPLPKADTVWLEEMTWMDVRDALKAGKTTAIISTGGIEPNGPWLVTGKHNYVLHANCDAIARKLGNAICAPIVKYVPEGDIEKKTGHMASPGTITMREETFQAVLTDVAESLQAHGFKTIVFIGDSGGNQKGQQTVADTLTTKWAGKAVALHIPEYYTYNVVTKHFEDQGAAAEGSQERRHARRPDHHAQHVHRRSEVGALRRAREGRQGVDRQRVDCRPRQGHRSGEEDRGVPRRPHHRRHQQGHCRQGQSHDGAVSVAAASRCPDHLRADAGARLRRPPRLRSPLPPLEVLPP